MATIERHELGIAMVLSTEKAERASSFTAEWNGMSPIDAFHFRDPKVFHLVIRIKVGPG
jgi:hypothetical protein